MEEYYVNIHIKNIWGFEKNELYIYQMNLRNNKTKEKKTKTNKQNNKKPNCLQLLEAVVLNDTFSFTFKY